MAPFFQRRIADPLKKLLVQGITPQKIALSVACGIVFGLFPVMGTTTVLCGGVAILFRLSVPAVQLVNYFVYPAQLILIVPFIRAGEYLLQTDRTRLSLPQMIEIFRHNHLQGLHILWRLALHGIFAWTVFAPVALVLLYRIFHRITARLAQAMPSGRGVSAVAS